MAGEYFSMGAGVDISPLLEGLPGNSCDAPHWGYVMQGRVVVTFDDRPAETGVDRRPVLLAARPQRPCRGGRRS